MRWPSPLAPTPQFLADAAGLRGWARPTRPKPVVDHAEARERTLQRYGVVRKVAARD